MYTHVKPSPYSTLWVYLSPHLFPRSRCNPPTHTSPQGSAVTCSPCRPVCSLFYINQITQYAFSCLASFPRCNCFEIHLPYHVLAIVHPFHRRVVLLYMDIHNLFAQKPSDGLLACFWFLTICEESYYEHARTTLWMDGRYMGNF